MDYKLLSNKKKLFTINIELDYLQNSVHCVSGLGFFVKISTEINKLFVCHIKRNTDDKSHRKFGRKNFDSENKE